MSGLLIVINGPIGAGKSAVAQALAGTFRQQGVAAAVIDLDVLYLMVDGNKPMASTSAWLRARRAAAALTDAFFSSGVDVVIVEGPFWNREERVLFVDRLTCGVRPRFVTLLVSYDEALRRVQGDLTRGISRDPAFLKWEHANFQTTLEPLKSTDIIFDSSDQTPHQIATAIAKAVARAPTAD